MSESFTYKLNKPPLIKDYMAYPVLTLRAEISIYNAMRFLIDNRISGAPVVDAEGKLIGLLSEKDCLHLVTKGVDHHLPAGNVADYMTKKVVTISPEMDIYYVAGIFLGNHYRRLPVIEHSRLIGLVSRRDVLRAIINNLEKNVLK